MGEYLQNTGWGYIFSPGNLPLITLSQNNSSHHRSIEFEDIGTEEGSFLLAKCPESDDSDSNLVVNPKYNKINRAMIDLKRNSCYGPGLANENIFQGF